MLARSLSVAAAGALWPTKVARETAIGAACPCAFSMGDWLAGSRRGGGRGIRGGEADERVRDRGLARGAGRAVGCCAAGLVRALAKCRGGARGARGHGVARDDRAELVRPVD